MASITITTSVVCASGGHFDFTIAGEKSATLRGIETTDITGPISDEELVTFVKLCIRLAKANRTINQLRNALQNGLLVNI